MAKTTLGKGSKPNDPKKARSARRLCYNLKSVDGSMTSPKKSEPAPQLLSLSLINPPTFSATIISETSEALVPSRSAGCAPSPFSPGMFILTQTPPPASPKKSEPAPQLLSLSLINPPTFSATIISETSEALVLSRSAGCAPSPFSPGMFIPTQTPPPACPGSPSAASCHSTALSCADPSQVALTSYNVSLSNVSDLDSCSQSTPRSIISISSSSLSQTSSISTSEGEGPFRKTSLTCDPPPRPQRRLFSRATDQMSCGGGKRPFLYRGPVEQTPSPPPVITWSTALSSPPSVISISSSSPLSSP